MRNDEFDGREILEHRRIHQLVEARGIAVEVVRAGRVMGRVARRADMDHRRNVVLDHLLVDWVPVMVRQWRVLPMPAGWIGVQIDADEPVFIDAAVDLRNAVLWRDPRTLRQHRHTNKILREQRADAVDQLVAGAGPGFAGRRITKVVAHAGGARREDRHVSAALALYLELATHDRLADLVIRDSRAPRRRLAGLVRLDLLTAPALVLTGGGGVVAVTIDDHETCLPLNNSSFPRMQEPRARTKWWPWTPAFRGGDERMLCLATPFANQCRTLRRSGHHKAAIAPGEHEPHAHADVFLHQLLGIDATHPWPFIVLVAGGDHRLVGGGDLPMAVLAGDPH